MTLIPATYTILSLIWAASSSIVCSVHIHVVTCFPVVNDVAKLRWSLFNKKQLQSSNLPSTRDALRQAIFRAHYQCMVLNSDTTAKPRILSPEQYGWKLDDDTWVPMKSLQFPASLSVLINCNCGKSRCRTTMCSCLNHEIRCSEMCDCCTYEEACDNMKVNRANDRESDDQKDEQ